ncbi:MAG: SGNH/GDSL hydrolase family protein [Bosea sp. (in: a-proteobacteria)]
MTIILPAFVFEAVTAEVLVSRRALFHHRKAEKPDSPVIVAYGDSWFCYPRESIVVPDDAPFDIVMRLLSVRPVLCIARPGDSLQSMADFADPHLTQALTTQNAAALLISAGGNDLVGGGMIAQHLRSGDRPLSDYLKPSFFEMLDLAMERYTRIIRMARQARPSLRVVTYGYAKAFSRKDGPWFRNPMNGLGIPLKKQSLIVARIMAAFASRLSALAAELDQELSGGKGHVVFVDTMSLVAFNEWYNELHPNSFGYSKIASVIEAKLAEIL